MTCDTCSLDIAEVTYPTGPIRIIVPFAAGGPADMLAQILSERLKAHWDCDVSIETVHGRNGIDGSQLLTKCAPDGHTLAISASAFYVNPNIFRNMPFDSIEDFEPVCLLAGGPNVLVVHPSVPVGSVAEFINYAKQNPGKLSYASGGYGSPSHLAGELFNRLAGVEIRHVPYKGHQAAGRALSEGAEVQLMYDAIFTCVDHVRDGDWKALGVTTPQRATALPDVPTMQEAGLTGFEVSPAMGLLAPAGTSREIVAKLSRKVMEILDEPEVVARIRNYGAEPFKTCPTRYKMYISQEIAKWGDIVRKTGAEVLDNPI